MKKILNDFNMLYFHKKKYLFRSIKILNKKNNKCFYFESISINLLFLLKY